MKDSHQIIKEWSEIDDSKKSIVDSLLDKSHNCTVFAFGRNEQSADLIKLIDIDAFIDDFTDEKIHKGKPIVTAEEALKTPSSIVINCILCTKPRAVFNRLNTLGFINILNFCDIYKYSNKLRLPDFVSGTRKDLIENSTQWQQVYDSFIDDESRITFNDVLSFRLTGDFSYLSNYEFRPLKQYFENFMNYKNEIFVDAGGFTGDTTEQFCRLYPNYKHVYLIEPSIENMTAAKIRLSNHKNITYINKGVSDKTEKLRFSSGSGSSSQVSDNGDIVINVAPIDELIKDKVTFIKMDLEGWELNALEGVKEHITKNHPKLAIAVYHKVDDFWKIYQFVMNIRNDYDIYLRHYTEGWAETVMYFSPKI